MGLDDRPRLTRLAGFAVLLRDERVLLAHGDYGPKRWGLPGGLVEDGESSADAAIRETKEETGLDIELDGLVATCDTGRVVLSIFAATIVGGTERPEPGEIRELRWCDLAGIDEIADDTWAMAQTIGRLALTGDLRPMREVDAMGPGGGEPLFLGG